MKRLLLLAASTGVFVIALWGGWQLYLPHLAQARMLETLYALGYPNIEIGDTNTSDGIISFQNIKLDKQAFDTINEITTPRPKINTLWQKKQKLQQVTVNELNLTRSWGELNKLQISKLWLKTRYLVRDIMEMTLHHGQLNASTPAGTFRIESTGTFVQQQQKQMTLLNGHIWSAQNKFILDSFIKGRFNHAPDKGHEIDIDIKNLSLNIDSLRLDRGAGWIEITKTGNTPLPYIAGQLDIGSSSINEINMPDMNLILNGDFSNYNIILKSKIKIGPHRGNLSAELKSGGAGLSIKINVGSKNPQLIINFLRELKNTATVKPFHTDLLTPLLLTEGNLRRIEKRLAVEGHNRNLVLTISGFVNELSGNISTGQSVIDIVP